MEFYKGETKDIENNYNKIMNTIFIFIILFIIEFSAYFVTKKFYFDLPDVYFSVSKNKVVAVISVDGKKLPLYPLPKKYIKNYRE